MEKQITSNFDITTYIHLPLDAVIELFEAMTENSTLDKLVLTAGVPMITNACVLIYYISQTQKKSKTVTH